MTDIEGRHEGGGQFPCGCCCYDSGLIGVLHLSSAGIIHRVNAYFASMLGYGVGELAGRHWESLLDPQDLAAVRNWRERLRQGSAPASHEACFRRRDGNPAHALIAASTLPSPLLLVLDISDHKTREREAIEEERRRRDLLIREVHHRIKNNLQGIVGLLNNQILHHPEAADLLQTPIRQIHSIALTYGLRSRTGDAPVFLCDLTRIAARAGQKSSHVPVAMDIPHHQSIEVNDGEVVSITLVINELLFNALKHSPDQHPQVTLALRKEADAANVIVRNRYRGPALDLNLASGKGLGTGLELVCSLLPKDGSARLTIRQQDEEVVAELRLRPPLVRLR